MSDETKTASERIEGKLDELGDKFKGQIDESAEALRTENAELKTRLDAVETNVRERITRGPEIADDKPKPISICRLAQAIATGDWSQAGYELECIQASRTLAAGTDSAGGYVVAAEYLANEFIEMIRDNSVCFEAGVRRLSGLTTSPVEIGKQTGGATAYWGAENTAITASEQTFGRVGMVPHPLTGLVKVSNQLIRMSNPSVETLIMEDLAAVLGLKLDLGILKGTGSSNEPLGIINTAGINTKSMNATVTLALMEDMLYELDKDNALKGKLSFVMHTREWSTIRALLIAAGITFNAWGKGVGKELFGYPVHTTNQLSITMGGGSDEGEILFGNFADCIVGEWGAIEFMASQHASDGSDHAFTQNQTWIRAIQLVDVAVRHAVSFCYTVDARA